jgi:uracil-DNA glycosylase
MEKMECIAHEQNANCPHFNKGKLLQVALIFSAPGRAEKECGRPVSGQTGKNLTILLDKLKSGGYFTEYDCIYDFRITNAIKTIEFNKETGRTEATKKEICKQQNIDRLYEEIKDIKGFIICFGEKAGIAIAALKEKYELPNVKIIKTRHLGLQSLNSIKGLVTPVTPEERINWVSECIITQINPYNFKKI